VQISSSLLHFRWFSNGTSKHPYDLAVASLAKTKQAVYDSLNGLVRSYLGSKGLEFSLTSIAMKEYARSCLFGTPSEPFIISI